MHFNPLSLLNTLCTISLIVSFYHSHSLTHSLTLTIPPSFNAYIGRRIDEMKALSDPMEARQSEEAQRGAFIPFYLHIAVMGYAVLYCIPPVLLFLSHVSCPLLSRLNSPISPLLSHLFSPALSPTIQHSGNLLEKLREQMDLCKSFANNKDECYSHVTDDERDILRNEGKEWHTHLNSPFLLWRTFYVEPFFNYTMVYIKLDFYTPCLHNNLTFNLNFIFTAVSAATNSLSFHRSLYLTSLFIPLMILFILPHHARPREV